MNDLETEGWELPEWTVTELSDRRGRYVVLIPVLNEGERIRRQLQKMEPYADFADFAIVDGGSTDEALDAGYLDRRSVRAFLVKKGPGRLGAQLRVGLAWALREGYEGVVLIDGNDKDDPSAIPAFCDGLRKGFDHLQGSRYIAGGCHQNTPLSRHLGVRLLHAPLVSMAAGFRYTDTTNGFRAYSRHFLLDPRVAPFRDVFRGYELHYYLAIRAPRLGFDVMEVPVQRRYPPGRPPTKIRGLRGNLNVLMALIKSCIGVYNPKGAGR